VAAAPELTERPGGVRALLAGDLAAGELGIAWLGQAGFAIRGAGRLAAIDPYLSDFLARECPDGAEPRERLMAAPIDPGELSVVDLVLCTHRHPAHMDPEALPALAAASPACRFVVPRAEEERARELGLPPDRTAGIDAGESIEPVPGVTVRAVPAAHEEIERSPRGEHLFLGYLVSCAGWTVYHSGDSIAWPGLDAHLGRAGIHLALLPVNGRDQARAWAGIPGNMTFEEARDLCAAARIPLLLAHHFGMFEIDAADPGALAREAAKPGPVRCFLPALDRHHVLGTSGSRR
jgi:L-ascorbate metabolism protein UlaG (beta-lactamase superfamily)